MFKNLFLTTALKLDIMIINQLPAAPTHRKTTMTKSFLRGKTSTSPLRAKVIALIISAVICTPACAESLIVQGSTTFNSRLMEPYQRAIEGMSGVSLQVIPNKTLNGLNALLEGRADLAMISSALDTELLVLRAMNKPGVDKLVSHQITNTRIAFVVHPSNPVRTAGIETIRKILLGRISNWRELGGPDLPIRVAFVSKAGGVTQTVQAQVLDGQPIEALNPIPMSSAEQVIKVVEQEPGALGLAQIRLVTDRKLPELATDVTVSQVLALVTLGEPSKAASEVIDATGKIASKRLAAAQ